MSYMVRDGVKVNSTGAGVRVGLRDRVGTAYLVNIKSGAESVRTKIRDTFRDRVRDRPYSKVVESDLNSNQTLLMWTLIIVTEALIVTFAASCPGPSFSPSPFKNVMDSLLPTVRLPSSLHTVGTMPCAEEVSLSRVPMTTLHM